MSKRVGHLPHVSPQIVRRSAIKCLSILALNAVMASMVLAGNGNVIRQVGGVHIDAEGVISMTPTDMRDRFVDAVKSESKIVSDEVVKSTEMRMISLKTLNNEIAKAKRENRTELPAEIRYMGGIQRIEHIFLYPEENDIVLAGPGEGWVVDEKGNVVGETTGQPVVQLEDLIVAMRTVNNARDGLGISCSIDPTPEGRRKYQAFVRKNQQVSSTMLKRAEEAMGPQKISLTGIPETSRYAQVLVAADFRMKRIAMHLDETPVKEIPSFLTIMKQKNTRKLGMMPRWWLACNYEPVSKSSDGLSWKINGPGVKAMTEDEFIDKDGEAKGAGKVNPIAQKWADNMTANYEKLSAAEPVFGDLRNIMDLSVIAALIEKEGMLKEVDLEIPMIASGDSANLFHSYFTPSTVPTQCSFMKIRRGTILTASGGVQVESWDVVEQVKEDDSIAASHKEAKPHGTMAVFWN